MTLDNELEELATRFIILMDLNEGNEEMRADIVKMLALISAVAIRDNALFKETFEAVMENALKRIEGDAQ
jgi:DNA-binding GntR family transcriptional regulator